MIIQLIGLPASGKTLVVNKIKQTNKNILFYDIKSFNGSNREKELEKELEKYQNSPKIALVESACGLENLSSIVVMLKVSKRRHCMNKRLRKEFVSNALATSLIDQMIPANYTSYNVESCEALINTIIKSGVSHAANSKVSSKKKSN